MSKRYEAALTAADLAALPDEAVDTSDIPPLDEAFWRGARVVMPGIGKRQVTLRLDAEVQDSFKAGGRGWLTRINAVLRAFVEAQREGRGGRWRINVHHPDTTLENHLIS